MERKKRKRIRIHQEMVETKNNKTHTRTHTPGDREFHKSLFLSGFQFLLTAKPHGSPTSLTLRFHVCILVLASWRLLTHSAH